MISGSREKGGGSVRKGAREGKRRDLRPGEAGCRRVSFFGGEAQLRSFSPNGSSGESTENVLEWGRRKRGGF